MASISPTIVKTPRRPPNARKASKERLAAIAAMNRPNVPTVRVVPTSDALRRVLTHPSGCKLRATGSTEWPMDKFTARRLAEGAIKIEDEKEDKKEDNKKEKAAHVGSTHHAS
jgi:hypothetical protein